MKSDRGLTTNDVMFDKPRELALEWIESHDRLGDLMEKPPAYFRHRPGGLFLWLQCTDVPCEYESEMDIPVDEWRRQMELIA